MLSPLNRDYFAEGLVSHPDSDFASRVLDILDNGASTGYEGPERQIESPNWPSTVKFAAAVQADIKSDLEKGRKVGPFHSPPLENFVVSPLGAFARKRSGKVRVIHDLSWPPQRSVNDGIDRDQCSLKYISVDNAVAACAENESEEPVMAKLDLAEAFKHIVVNPRDWHLLGSVWDPACINQPGPKEYYFSTVLEFGMRSSPVLFDHVAAALQYIMIRSGASEHTLRYMDDYITISGDIRSCQASLDIMIECCHKAGFEIQPSKVTAPDTCIEFLGVIIDTKNVSLDCQVIESRKYMRSSRNGITKTCAPKGSSCL